MADEYEEVCTLTHLTLTKDDVKQLAKLYDKYEYGILEHMLRLASDVAERDCFNLEGEDYEKSTIRAVPENPGRRDSD